MNCRLNHIGLTSSMVLWQLTKFKNSKPFLDEDLKEINFEFFCRYSLPFAMAD